VALPPELPERTESLSVGALLILLFLIVFAGSARRRAAGAIRLASPAFVPLAPDAATEVAGALGAAVGELLEPSRRGGER
jgi:hypothetical protein